MTKNKKVEGALIASVRDWGRLWEEMSAPALHATISGEHKKAFMLWAEAALKDEKDWLHLLILLETQEGFLTSLRRN